MAIFGETADLVAALKLNDQFTGPLKGADRLLGQFDAHLTNTQGRAYKAGQQIGTGIQNGVKIAAAALTGMAGLLLLSAKEGQEAQNVQVKYAQAIANSGKITAQYVAALNAQQDALLNLSGVDDERIKAAQTQLIQMGLTGDKVIELTKLSLDLSKATGKDLTASTLAVGKAFQGNNRALLQLGIVVPKGADAIAILNQRFKGTTEALSGQLDTRLEVLNQRLANVREDAGIKLLPVLTRIVDVVGTKLVPAFGKFIDAILPHAIAGLDRLAGFLEGGKATEAFDSFLRMAQTAAPIIKAAAEDTLFIVEKAVGLFSSLPPEIQALAVAGLTINKLTGGLVTNIAGGLISAVLAGFKGVMSVNAGVVNVNAPLGTGGGAPGAPAAGGGALAALAPAGLAAADVAILAGAIHAATNPAVQAQIQSGGGAVGQRASQFQAGTTRAVQQGFHQLLTATERSKIAMTNSQRAVADAIRRQDLTPNVTLTVPVTVKNILDSRVINSSLTRYQHTYVNGQITRTSGFLP